MQQLRLIKTIISLIFCIIFFNAFSQDSNVIFEKLTNKDGLSQGTINSIFQDSKGFIWFGTNDGYKFKTFFHSHFDTNSISNNHILAITEDLEGNIWIGTKGGGLNCYDISEAKEIVLDYRDVIFSFEFAVLNYYKTDKNRYAYKLEGLEAFDKDWIHLGTKNNIDFTGLKPGDYILRIKVSNNDGIWNEEGASLKI